MAISFDNALGIHPQAIALRSQRAELLSQNLSNSDTPGYKARDMDFDSMLKSQISLNDRLKADGGMMMQTTHQGHIRFSDQAAGQPSLLYRTPLQASLDGNTVDTQIEQSEYAKNAMLYQASFTILNGKFRGLISAIRGE